MGIRSGAHAQSGRHPSWQKRSCVTAGNRDLRLSMRVTPFPVMERRIYATVAGRSRRYCWVVQPCRR